MIADPRYPEIAPDWAFALHNMRGTAIGAALFAAGPVNCASMGLKITLTGKTAHASQPEAGTSPAAALARLIPALATLGPGGPLHPGYRLVTLAHARLGEAGFGIAPGQAEIWATLRTLADDGMADLLAQAEAVAHTAAETHGLTLTLSHHDVFHGCTNHPDATAHLGRALDALAIPHSPEDLPMRGSEDFGRFGASARSAMVFLGAGTRHSRLHNPDYDFPDRLIPGGTAIFLHTIRALLG